MKLDVYSLYSNIYRFIAGRHQWHLHFVIKPNDYYNTHLGTYAETQKKILVLSITLQT